MADGCLGLTDALPFGDFGVCGDAAVGVGVGAPATGVEAGAGEGVETGPVEAGCAAFRLLGGC